MKFARIHRPAFIATAILFTMGGACTLGHAAEAIGTVTHLSGVLSVKHADGTVKILSAQSRVAQGDVLSTQTNAYARIKFIDNAELVLRPDSVLKIASYVYQEAEPKTDSIHLDLQKGGLRAASGVIGQRNHDAVSYTTPDGTIQTLGTNFGALFCQSDCGGIPTPSGAIPVNGLHVDVTSGIIVVSNRGGTSNFSAGQFGYVASPSTPPVVIPPNVGLRVTMPPSISTNVPPTGGSGGKSAAVDCVVR